MPGVLEPAPGAAQPPARRSSARSSSCSPLPVFALAHWPLAAWGIAAALWVGGQAIVLVVRQLPLGMGSLAASGAVAFGRMFRAVAVMVVLHRRHRVGLPPRAPRRRACTCSRTRRSLARRWSRTSEGRHEPEAQAGHVDAGRAALVAPASASAASFDPSSEFALKDWVPIHLGGLDLSINKAVVYLLVGSGAHLPARHRPDALAPAATCPAGARPSAR